MIGSYMGALKVLGLKIETMLADQPNPNGADEVCVKQPIQAQVCPTTIPLQKYPQLRQLAWHVRDDFELTPEEAFGLYERYRHHMSFDQIDLVELNEAFACQVLAVLKGWGWHDESRLNVNGSGISLGHPIGATGVRIMATLLNELKRRKGRYGLETMCIGGGQGIAALFESA